MRTIIILVSFAAIGLALTIAAAGPGTRFGYWDYGFGLTLIRNLALPVLVAAGAASLCFFVSLFAARGLAAIALIAALAAGFAGMVPLKMKQAFEANPFIHDITTDFDDPPQIVAAADLPRENPPQYLGDEIAPRTDLKLTVAQAQKEAFPDIEPVLINASVDESAEIVRGVVRSMDMEILADKPAGNGWRLEAAATSLWFGFVDDFIVRLRSEGAQTRVDVRSKSRVGGSDLGANAKRVREFYEKLEAVN